MRRVFRRCIGILLEGKDGRRLLLLSLMRRAAFGENKTYPTMRIRIGEIVLVRIHVKIPKEVEPGNAKVFY